MHKRRALLIGLLALASYIYILPRWADWNQNSRLDLVRALVEQRTVTIDAYVANTGDYALYRGHAYSDKAPGPAFLALPAALALEPAVAHPVMRSRLVQLAGSGELATTLNPIGTGINGDKAQHFALQVVLTLLAVALPAALSVSALAWLLQQRMAAQPALLVATAYGLATGVAAYAGNFYSHALVAALLLGAWTLATLPRSAPRATAIGLLLGWAVISEYPAVFPALMVALGTLWRWRAPRALIWIALGGLPPLLLLAVYDWVAFGTILPVGYSYSALWQQQHGTGFMSLTYPHPQALWGLLFGLFRGLFMRAPWLLLALPGLLRWRRSGRDRAGWWVVTLASLSIVLFYSSSVMWWGGFAAGPRYLLPAVPFLALAGAPAAAALWQSTWGRVGLVTLVAASMALTWAEAVAGQSFPPDAIANPWLDYVLPAWGSGDIARNLGTVVGLPGVLSLLPLAALLAACLCWSLFPPRARLPLAERQPTASPKGAISG